MSPGDALSFLDSWMRRILGPGWLRGREDRAILAKFLLERFPGEVGLLQEVDRLRPEPVVPEGLEISGHAVDQYIERTGAHPSRSREWVAGRILQQLSMAEEVWLKPKFRVSQLCRHHRPARYFRSSSGLIFVVEEGNVLRTIHKGEADRWKSHP